MDKGIGDMEISSFEAVVEALVDRRLRTYREVIVKEVVRDIKQALTVWSNLEEVGNGSGSKKNNKSQ